MPQLLEKLIFGLPCIVIALTVHEFFHAYVAFRCGDPSAKYEKRITLNPLAHIEPIGGAMLVLSLLFSPFVLGWAKPVPVSEHYLGNPRRDVFLVSFAGPLSNFAMAVAAGLILRIGIFQSGDFFGAFLIFFIRVNLSLGLFNLIPCPPLDGWKILGSILPKDISYKMKGLEQQNPMITTVALAILIFSGLVPIILGPPYTLLYALITGGSY